MILSHAAIVRELGSGGIQMRPEPVESDIRQCGIRVHLGDTVLISSEYGPINLANGKIPAFERLPIGRDGFILEPGTFVLASTREVLRVGPHLLCSVDGRSTVARLGVFVHCSSSTIDNVADSQRSIVLELFNCGPHKVRIFAGDPIAQVMFSQLDGTITLSDQAQYAGQLESTPPDTSFLRAARPATDGSEIVYRHQPDGYNCPFCQIVSGDSSAYTTVKDVVLQDDYVTAFVASHWWPNNAGAVVIAVNPHIENLYELPDRLGAAVFRTSRQIAIAMKVAYKCAGISTRQHNEPAGGQDVWHYHSHVFPRADDDRLYVLDPEKHLAPSDVKELMAAKLRKALASMS